MIKWFDSKDAEQFGQSLARAFVQKIPNPSLGKQKRSVNIQNDVVDKLYAQIEQFKLNNKLNIYKKAKLASAFKFEMLNEGHQPKFVDQVTTIILKKF